MQRLEVFGAVRPTYGSLGVKRLTAHRHDDLLLCSDWPQSNYVRFQAEAVIRVFTSSLPRTDPPVLIFDG